MRAESADNTRPLGSSGKGVSVRRIVSLALASLLLSSCAGSRQGKPAKPKPSYLVVGEGLTLVDEKFGKLGSLELGGRLEYAVSPDRSEIAVAWIDGDGGGNLQVFATKDLAPLCARTPIAPYATITLGFWHPILWMGASALVVEFVEVPRPSPDRGFDSFYAQVFRLPGQADRSIGLHPEYPQRIELPADNTHVLAVDGTNATVLNETVSLRSVNLKTGAASAAIEIRPRGQDGILESPMGWCAKDDSTLLLFGFDGSVREIRVGAEPKIVRRFALPDLPSGAHVGIGEVATDPFRPDRFLIGIEFLGKSGPVEVRTKAGLERVDSMDRGLGWAFAAGKDGRILSWSPDARAAVHIQGPSGASELEFEGTIGAIVPLN